MIKIFISYSRADEFYAEKLYNDLLKKGFSPWWDKISLLPGQDWKTEINRAIRQSHFIILLLSRNSVNRRGYFHKEIQIACDVFDTIPIGQVFLLPTRLEECQLPENLMPIHWVNMFPDWEQGIEKLCSSTHYQRIKEVLTYSIEEQTPLPNDLIVKDIEQHLDQRLRAFSGYWQGRWGELLPCQLIVEEITADSALIVYTWGENPFGAFDKGWHRFRSKIISPGVIEFGNNNSNFIFEMDINQNIVYGIRKSPDGILKIIMRRKQNNVDIPFKFEPLELGFNEGLATSCDAG